MALEVIGGVGKGLMAGSEFVANRRARDTAADQRQQQIDVQTEQFDWAKQDRENQKRLAEITAEWSDKDLNDPENFNAFAKSAIPLMSPEQQQAMIQMRQGLEKQVGAQAVNEYLHNGSLDGFQAAIDKKMPGAKISKVGDRIILTGADGKSREFSSAMGLSVALRMPGAISQIQSADAAAADRRAKDAKTAADEALAAQRRATADGKSPWITDESGRTIPNPYYNKSGGSRSGGSGGASSPFDTQDIDRVLNQFGADLGSEIVSTAENIIQSNPNLGGSPAQAIEIARRIHAGGEDGDPLRIERLYDRGSQDWRLGVKTQFGDVYLGPSSVDAYSGLEPEKARDAYELDSSEYAATVQSLESTAPQVLSALGPYLNGSKPLSALRQDNAIPAAARQSDATMDRLEAFVLAGHRLNRNAPSSPAGGAEKPSGEAPASRQEDAARPDDRPTSEQTAAAAERGVRSPEGSADEYREAWRKITENIEGAPERMQAANIRRLQGVAERLRPARGGVDVPSARILAAAIRENPEIVEQLDLSPEDVNDIFVAVGSRPPALPNRKD